MSELGILPNPIPFGKYYLLERVNIGGMAEIFKAKAFGVEGFERLLAVKKILASIAEDEAFINMFIDEAKIAGQLNHPNIAQIFDLGKVDDSYFIALEYISGKDLKTIFERARRLGEKVSIPRICYILMKICEGLGHAHQKKDAQGAALHIVHRDVSPQNILISYEGEAKIIDFGIAKAQGKTSQTQVGILKGKFSYMSPEQVRGLHIDHRSDIFSLGIVLYEMLTLERLFLGESDFDTLEKIRKVEMSPPSLYNPHIPKELEDIVLKALAKSPEERFQSAAEFDDALQRFMRNQGYYFTNKDLGAYMKEAFSADIEFENKKIEYYRSLNLQPPVESPITSGPVSGRSGAPPLPGLAWGDDEKDTQIYNRDTHAPDESIVESLIDADIIFSEDLAALNATVEPEQDPPTVEFNRDALSKSLEEFSFDDPAAASAAIAGSTQSGAAGRRRLATSRLPSIEPRRDPSTTMPGVQYPPNRALPKERSNALVILGVTAVTVLAGAALIYTFWPWDAEVHFAPTPSEVTIKVDGNQVFQGKTPYEYKLAPGVHTIEISSEGYEPYPVQQEFQARTTYDIKSELKPLKPVLDHPTLQITTTPPDAVVVLGGESFSEPSPKEITSMPAGSYTLTVTKPGYEPISKELDLSQEGAKLAFTLLPAKFTVELSSAADRAEFELYPQGSSSAIKKGRLPETIEDLDASQTYRLVVTARDKKRFEQTISPSDERTRVIKAVLEDDQAVVAARQEADSRSTPRSNPSERAQRLEPPKPAVATAKVDPPKESPPKKDPPKAADPPKKGVGTLTIGSRPAARVYIDGKDTGKYTPLKDYKVSAGKHKILLVNEKHNMRRTHYVTVEAGESKRIINK